MPEPRTARPAARAPGRNGFVYRPRYGIIVLCDDEADQAAKYQQLQRAGHKLKVVAV